MKFTGGNVDFRDAEFAGGYVDFSHAEFAGVDVDFSHAEFVGGTVNFGGAAFTGGRGRLVSRHDFGGGCRQQANGPTEGECLSTLTGLAAMTGHDVSQTRPGDEQLPTGYCSRSSGLLFLTLFTAFDTAYMYLVVVAR